MKIPAGEMLLWTRLWTTLESLKSCSCVNWKRSLEWITLRKRKPSRENTHLQIWSRVFSSERKFYLLRQLDLSHLRDPINSHKSSSSHVAFEWNCTIHIQTWCPRCLIWLKCFSNISSRLLPQGLCTCYLLLQLSPSQITFWLTPSLSANATPIGCVPFPPEEEYDPPPGPQPLH